jgi:hypothetical protein
MPTTLIVVVSNVKLQFSDMPPNSSKDPKVGPRVKQWKKKRVKARSLTRNILGVGGCDGALGWD